MKVPAWRAPLMCLVASLLMQAAWIVALPPFRGIDEFDHAFRAASVARGEWLPSGQEAQQGRGELVTVPGDLVRAAHYECAALSYTGHDNCNAVSRLGNGEVTVASSAARYNPLFYWLVGSAALPFHGFNALYAMRIAAALACSLFVALAAWNLSIWARTRWMNAALLIGLTPVAVYSTAIAAPNGVEFASALSLWTSLLGLTQCDDDTIAERRLLWSTLPAVVALATVRSLGPMFLGLAVLVVVLVNGRGATTRLVRRHGRLVLTVGTAGVAAVLASVWWILGSRTLVKTHPGHYIGALGSTLRAIPLWLFQSIAAFPTLNERAPTVVYATWLVPALALVLLGWKYAGGRMRLTLIIVTAASAMVPAGLTLLTFSGRGVMWQGRYGLPFSVGLILLAGLAVERSGLGHRSARPAVIVGGLAVLVAQTVGVASVQLHEQAGTPRTAEAWSQNPVAVAALLMGAGVAILASIAVGRETETSQLELSTARASASPVPTRTSKA